MSKLNDLERKFNKEIKAIDEKIEEEIKAIKHELGYKWEHRISFSFSYEDEIKPEFKVAEVLNLILGHLGIEIKRINPEPYIKIIKKKK